MRDRAKGVTRELFPSTKESIDAARSDDPEEIVACILDPNRRGELYPLYHRLRSLAPAHRTEVAGLPPGCRILTSFRHVDRVARSAAAVNDPRTAEVFDYDGTGSGAFYQVMRHAMLFLEKRSHDRIRRLVYRAFTPAAVAPLREVTEGVAHELLDVVESEGGMDFVEDYSYPLPVRAIMRLLGLPAEVQAALEQWAWDFARAGDPMTATPDTIRRGNEAAIGFREFFDRILDERRRAPGEDLISALVAAEEDGEGLSRDETISTLVLLLQAGHETTSDLLGNALVGLFRHPGELDRLRTRPGLLQTATEELLRYDTSVQMSMRLLTEDIELDDLTLPAGSMVALGYGAANRDPEVFEEPDRLDLDRAPIHLAFSAGAYYCLGNALARTEIQAAFRVLFERIPSIRPARDHFEQRWTARLRGPLELRVAWDETQ